MISQITAYKRAYQTTDFVTRSAPRINLGLTQWTLAGERPGTIWEGPTGTHSYCTSAGNGRPRAPIHGWGRWGRKLKEQYHIGKLGRLYFLFGVVPEPHIHQKLERISRN